MTLPRYYAWEDVPDHLKTKTSLSKLGLRLAKGQQPAAIKTSSYYKTADYNLYDKNEAVPKRKQSKKQKDALALVRATAPAHHHETLRQVRNPHRKAPQILRLLLARGQGER